MSGRVTDYSWVSRLLLVSKNSVIGCYGTCRTFPRTSPPAGTNGRPCALHDSEVVSLKRFTKRVCQVSGYLDVYMLSVETTCSDVRMLPECNNIHRTRTCSVVCPCALNI